MRWQALLKVLLWKLRGLHFNAACGEAHFTRGPHDLFVSVAEKRPVEKLWIFC
jgi:hypothetical protein